MAVRLTGTPRRGDRSCCAEEIAAAGRRALVTLLPMTANTCSSGAVRDAKDAGIGAAQLGRGRVAPGGTVLVGSGERDAFQLAPQGTRILYPLRGGEVARIGPEEVRQRYGVDPKTSLRSAVIPRTNCLARLGLGQNVPLNWCGGRLVASLTPVSFRTEAMILRLYRRIATMEVENLAGSWP
jgi:hypothetical protein